MIHQILPSCPTPSKMNTLFSFWKGVIWTFAIDLDYVRNGNAYKNSNGET